MTKREFLRLTPEERTKHLNYCVACVCDAINVPSEYFRLRELERMLNAPELQWFDHWAKRYLRPDCACRKGSKNCYLRMDDSHSLPPWFVRQADPAMRELRRVWQWMHSTNTEKKP
jgi:hypothetical protein